VGQRDVLCVYAHECTEVGRFGVIFNKHNLTNTRVLDEPPAHLARSAVNVKRSAINGGTPSGGLYDRIRLGVDAHTEFVAFTLWNVQALPLAPDV